MTDFIHDWASRVDFKHLDRSYYRLAAIVAAARDLEDALYDSTIADTPEGDAIIDFREDMERQLETSLRGAVGGYLSNPSSSPLVATPLELEEFTEGFYNDPDADSDLADEVVYQLGNMKPMDFDQLVAEMVSHNYLTQQQAAFVLENV